MNIGALGWSMRNACDVDDDISLWGGEAAPIAHRGRREGRTRGNDLSRSALLRRLEGVLIALGASSPKSVSENVHDSALRDTRVFCKSRGGLGGRSRPSFFRSDLLMAERSFSRLRFEARQRHTQLGQKDKREGG